MKLNPRLSAAIAALTAATVLAGCTSGDTGNRPLPTASTAIASSIGQATSPEASSPPTDANVSADSCLRFELIAGDPNVQIATGDIFDNVTSEQIKNYLACTRNVGATWIRTDYKRSTLESEPTANDDLEHLLEDASIKLHAIFNSTPKALVEPACAQDPRNDWYNCPPADVQAEAQYWTTFLDTHPTIMKVEVGNEPNARAYYVDNPNAYWSYYLAVHAAIKAKHPGVQVMPASTASVGETGPDEITPYDWYSLGFDAGLTCEQFDSLGMHPYDFPEMPRDAPGSNWAGIIDVHQLLVDHGCKGLIDITEMGFPTLGEVPPATTTDAPWAEEQPVTEEVQAAAVKITIERWRALHKAGIVGLLGWYSLVDQNSGEPDLETNYGLVRTDFTLKGGRTGAWAQLRVCNMLPTQPECALA